MIIELPDHFCERMRRIYDENLSGKRYDMNRQEDLDEILDALGSALFERTNHPESSKPVILITVSGGKVARVTTPDDMIVATIDNDMPIGAQVTKLEPEVLNENWECRKRLFAAQAADDSAKKKEQATALDGAMNALVRSAKPASPRG